ncbi:hypothetical protein ACFV2S_10055 [Streptomyces sp. NPDC059695]|uniref:hypothetical protein n=1 Tax=Streptomyces sp. NPDC059695 TaxID=3346910 RepID=UPI0036C64186
MTSEPHNSPATLYGPASLLFGVLGLVATLFAGVAGGGIPLLTASLAITFALLGLGRGMNRAQCVTGLVTGGIPLAWLVFALTTVTV